MKFLSRIYYLLAYILLPLSILLSVLLMQLTNSNFYTGLLKKSNIVGSYIQAVKLQTEEKIKIQINDEVHLDKYRSVMDSSKREYEDKLNLYESLNKDKEYTELQDQKKEISDLTYQKAPSIVKTPEDFKKYKEEETERIDGLIGDIEKYRKQNKYVIEKISDELESLEEKYKDSENIFKDKEKEARKIISSHEDSLKGQILSDLKKITPVLTKELNRRLIDEQIEPVINEYIDYLSSYQANEESGFIYTDNLESYISGDNILHVKLPEKEISLYVDYESSDGTVSRKHLISDIFVEKIKNIDGLKNPREFQKVFRFTESGMAEMISRSYLSKAGISLRNGIITLNERELSGEDAEILCSIMLFFTWGKYLKYILPVFAFIIFLSLFFSKDRIKKRNRIKRIFIYPSILFIIICALFIFFVNGIPSLLEMDVLSSGNIFLKSVLNKAAFNLIVPAALIYIIMFIIGIFIKKKEQPADQ